MASAGRGRWGLGRSTVVVTVLLVAAGCDDYQTDQGGVGFLDDVLVTDRVFRFESGGSVAVGSRACPTFDAYYFEREDGEMVRSDVLDPPDDSWLRDCFVPSLSGPGALEGQCIRIEGEGEVRWDLARAECPVLEPHDIGDQSLRFVGTDPATLTARFDAYWDRFAAGALHPGAAGSFPEGFGEYPESPVEVVAGGEARLVVAVLDAAGRAVAWSDASVVPGIVAGQPEVPAGEEPDEVIVRPTGVGDAIEPTLELSGATLRPGRMVGVEADAIASLEIVVAHWTRDDGAAGDPVFARAIARRSDGSELRGTPVSWEVVDGALAMHRDEAAGGPDYMMLGGNCEAPPTEGTVTRTAMLQARFGPHLARMEMEWTVDAADCGDQPCTFEPDEACEGPEVFELDDRGCGCTASSKSPSPWLAALTLLGLLGVRRRRALR